MMFRYEKLQLIPKEKQMALSDSWSSMVPIVVEIFGKIKQKWMQMKREWKCLPHGSQKKS